MATSQFSETRIIWLLIFCCFSAYNLFTEQWTKKPYAEIYQKFIYLLFAWRICIHSRTWMDGNNKLHLFIALVNHTFAHELLLNTTQKQKKRIFIFRINKKGEMMMYINFNPNWGFFLCTLFIYIDIYLIPNWDCLQTKCAMTQEGSGRCHNAKCEVIKNSFAKRFFQSDVSITQSFIHLFI